MTEEYQLIGDHMQVQRRFHRWLILSIVFVATFGTSGLLTAEQEDQRLASATAQELWRKSSDQILAGDFGAAKRTLEQVRKIQPNHAGVNSALAWMKEAETLRASRERFRDRMYEYYVNKALEAVKEAKEYDRTHPAGGADRETPTKDVAEDKPDSSAEKADSEADEKGEEEKNEDEDKYKWSLALRYAQFAMGNSTDKDAFRNESWLPEIIESAKRDIERYKAEHKWADAYTLYDVLAEIYPDEQEYEDGATFCRKRAHLDFVYGENGTWKKDLADVDASALGEILDRIDADYVKKPDYRELCLHGLEHMLILAQSESLIETFPTLGERDLVARFVKRIERLRDKYVEEKEKFRARNVRRVFNRVLDVNSDTLNLPEAVIVDEYIAGMLEPLDEFTAVIWPAELSEFNKQTRGEFVGVGIQITKMPGDAVRVESPLEGSPAYRAGIKPGDMITHIEGKETKEMTITGAVREITGEPGTTVTLTVFDPAADKSRDYVLTRENIKIRTVRGHVRDDSRPTGWDYFIDPTHKIGYIRVSGFMEKTVDDLKAALRQLRQEDCRGLILDLRFNPGGLLTSAVSMCELFLDENAPIVRTMGRNPRQNMTISAHADRVIGDMPMIVMVNEYSASASEIVAGALAGLKQACIIGTRTFGKGSVQNLIPIMSNMAYLKLTTAHYYVPDADLPGENQWYLLHKEKGAKTWGVEPHIKVEVIPQELNKILRLRRERDLLKGINQEGEIPEEILERKATTSQPTDEEDDFPEDEDKDVDPQLATAIDVMRMKLISHQPWALAPRLARTITQAHKKADQSVKPKNR